MGLFDSIFGSAQPTTAGYGLGLSKDDQRALINQGLLRAGLGILSANGQTGVTPFQAISSGLLGGLDSVQQGADDLQRRRYTGAIEQATLGNMQLSQANASREAEQKNALRQAVANNTDANGNIDIPSVVRDYGRVYPEDAPNVSFMLHGGKPELRDTSKGAMQVYPDGYTAYLQDGSPQQGLLGEQAQMGGQPPMVTAINQAPLLRAVQQVESGGNPNAVSPKGATGLLQVMPATAANPGFGIAPSNGTPQDTYRVGQQYLGALVNKYGQAGGVAAYNWGPGNLDRALASNGGNLQAALASAPAETQNYVPKVLGLAGHQAISSDASLPPGRISFQTPSKTTNAEDEKYARLLNLGVPQPAALEAAYGVKPQTVTGNAPSVPMPDGNLPTGQQYLDTLPPARKQLAQAVIDGRYPIPKGFSLKNPQSWQLMQDVVQADPDFDATNYDARANAAKQYTSATSPNAPANQIRSVQTIANHLQTISSIMPKLNLSSWGDYNQAKNWWATKQGKTDPDYTRALGAYQQAAKSIGDETAKLFAGTGSALADREHVAQMLDPSQPKEKLQGSLGTLADLVQGRLTAINDQAVTALGPLAASRLNILSTDQQRTLNDIKSLAGNALYGTGKDQGKAQQGSVQMQRSDVKAKRYMIGQVLTVNGKKWKVIGLSDPTDPEMQEVQ